MAIDRLITEFGAIDKFTPVAQRVSHSARQVEHALNSLLRHQQMNFSVGGGLSSGVGAGGLAGLATSFNPVGLVLTALTATLFAGVTALTAYGGALMMLARESVNAAAEMQALQATLIAVTGNAEKAGQKMEFLRRFARESIFEFRDLARAGTLLESFGLRMERVLPVIARLGAVFGASRELLDQLASALGRIGAGQFGEAMEVLRRFGISAQALREEGVQITAGGQVVSQATAVLEAVERIVLKRFGNITSMMSATLIVQLSNLKDSIFQIFEVIGRAILPHVQKIVSAVSNGLAGLNASGAIERIASSFGSAAEMIARLAVQAMPTVLAWMAALIEKGPLLFMAIAKAITAFAQQAMNVIESIVNQIGQALVSLHNLFVSITRSLFGLLPGLRVPEPIRFEPIQLGKFLAGAGGPLGIFFDQVRARANELLSGIGQGSQSELSTVSVGSEAGSFWSRQQTLTAEIAENTRATKEMMKRQIEWMRVVLGGGELASFGVTPVERFGRSEVRASANDFVSEIVRRLQRLRVVR